MGAPGPSLKIGVMNASCPFAGSQYDAGPHDGQTHALLHDRLGGMFPFPAHDRQEVRS